jgi:hypothetical protein
MQGHLQMQQVCQDRDAQKRLRKQKPIFFLGKIIIIIIIIRCCPNNIV